MNNIAALEDRVASPTRVTVPTSVQTDLATRHKHGVSSLLAHRDDLRGVYAFADIVEESVRWSA